MFWLRQKKLLPLAQLTKKDNHADRRLISPYLFPVVNCQVKKIVK